MSIRNVSTRTLHTPTSRLAWVLRRYVRVMFARSCEIPATTTMLAGTDRA